MTIFDCWMSKTGHFGGHFDPLGVKSTPWEGSILTPWGVILAMGYSFGLQGPIWTPRGVILTPSGPKFDPKLTPWGVNIGHRTPILTPWSKFGIDFRPPQIDMVKIWH